MPALRWTLVAVVILGATSACGAGASTRSAPAPAQSTHDTAASPSSMASSELTPMRPRTTVAPTSTQPSTSKSTPKAPTTAIARPPARPPVPPVSAQARADGLVDVRTVVPDAIIDLRYATSNNFVGLRLYPVDARCLVHTTMAPGLAAAAAELRTQGLLLVFWDCYRPHAVQIRMFQAVPNPNWVARPTAYARSHETGRSVDITLARASTTSSCAASQRIEGHCRLDMGTDFDDFSSRAHAFATTGVSADAQGNRARLRQALNVGGLIVYSGEWWHFDGPGAAVNRPVLSAPVD